MGRIARLFSRRRAAAVRESAPARRGLLKRYHRCRFEQLETRQLLTVAPIQIGMVYFEDASGNDELPDTFELTFSGGAPGTQLTELRIETDKLDNGLTIGDVFFDTKPGGLGAFGHSPFQLVSSNGFTVTAVEVEDGGTVLTMRFSGFDAGERLIFTIDVDEMGFLGPNAVAEGNEFEGSRLIGKFSAPHYFDAEGMDIFYDAYDDKLAASGLNLPPDSYMPPLSTPHPVHTAAAIFPIVQQPLPISISGTVYEDLNVNNQRNAGEPGISKVQLTLLVHNGTSYVSTGLTTLTDSQGNYRFEGLAPGNYRVVETQPSGYFSVGATEGNVAGASRGSVLNPDTITGIELLGGEDSVRNDFAEARPNSISGFVYHDANNNGIREVGESPIPGTTVILINAAGQPTGQTTVTDAQGHYSFANLPPGTYGVIEVQPNGYIDGLDRAGTLGGTAHNPGDRIDGIVLTSNRHGQQYNFGELLPASIAGRVHADLNGNCLWDPGEVGIAGVTIQLLNATGVVIDTTLTDAEGKYEFVGLMPGTYGIREIQPEGYFDGGERAGSAGGDVSDDLITNIVLGSGINAVDYDFCEKPPASIAGRVHADLNGNCLFDPGEWGIAGVTIQLLDATGIVIDTTLTDAEGRYKFDNLAPGTYGIREIQPEGYFDGGERAGTAGGDVSDDLITNIVLGANIDATGYDFCEKPPGSISGFVFVDGPTIVLAPDDVLNVADHRTGVRKPGDQPLAGVTLRLGDLAGEPILDAAGRPRTTVTDANGFYRFDGLPQGLYTVYQVHPAGYIDGIDTPGTLGGLAVNPGSTIDLSFFAGDPRNDAILRIPVFAGRESPNNNFSEVLVDRTPPPPPPPPEIPPLFPDVPPDVPPGLAPIPSVVAPVIPPPEPLLPPPPPLSELLRGGGGIPYTWHLSVIDAGFPRGRGPQQAYIRGASGSFDAGPWSGLDLNQGTWELMSDDGVPQVTGALFGLPGAIPVVGDWNGDGVDQMGLYYNGHWYLDLNGNGIWDEGDLWALLGTDEDLPVAGDWDGDGKDDIGIFGPMWTGDPRAIAAEPGLPSSLNTIQGKLKNVPPRPEEATNGERSLRRTAQGRLRADLIDHVFRYGEKDDQPIVGDWNGDGVATIGIYRDGAWRLDLNGNGRFDADDGYFTFGQAGDRAVVGDFNGDGIDQIGVYRNGRWYIDSNSNYQLDAHDEVFDLGDEHAVPIVGDWNGDGVDQIGIYRPATAGEVAP